jgi:hypothetical protein
VRALVAAAAAALAAIAALGPGCGPCQTLGQSGPTPTGSLSFVAGDGARVSADLSGDEVDVSVDASAITFYGTFKDAIGQTRSFTLSAGGLSAGATVDLSSSAQLCMPRVAGGEPVCAPVTGSLEVRSISTDCKFTTNCGQNIDATLHAVSAWQGTTLTLDATIVGRGAWQDAACEEG